MGFQREGIKFALKHGGRLLVGDEMGLGKTVQAIGIMACYKDEWPCIIITPSSLRGQPRLWLMSTLLWTNRIQQAADSHSTMLLNCQLLQ